MRVIFTSIHWFCRREYRDVIVIFTSVHCFVGESIEM